MPKHLLRFHSGSGKPTMIYREEGAVGALELSGKAEIDFTDRLACIGFRTPEGYCSCMNRAIHTRQCPTCAAMDISRAYTVGDFSNFPALYEKAKEEEYVLYLAGFGEGIIKCGVTRNERFSERMREQGADFGAIIAKFLGPDKVYDAEASIQARFNFNNSVRLAQKMRLLDFGRDEARRNFASSVELVAGSGILPDFTPLVHDFSEFYPRVKKAIVAESVHGSVLGAKGEILLFRDGGKDFAVNMRKKVGTFF